MPNRNPPAKPFKKGNKHAKGGKRDGAGRRPDWFKSAMAKLACTQKAVDLVKDLVNGGDVDEFITQQGECIPHRAKAEVRLKGLEFAAKYGGLAPVQELKGEITVVPRFDIVIEGVRVNK